MFRPITLYVLAALNVYFLRYLIIGVTRRWECWCKIWQQNLLWFDSPFPVLWPWQAFICGVSISSVSSKIWECGIQRVKSVRTNCTGEFQLMVQISFAKGTLLLIAGQESSSKHGKTTLQWSQFTYWNGSKRKHSSRAAIIPPVLFKQSLRMKNVSFWNA